MQHRCSAAARRGSVVRLNPRSSFVGDTGSAASHLAVLYARVPGRF